MRNLFLAAALLITDAAAGGWELLPEEMLSVHHKAVAHWGTGMHETAAREFALLLAASPPPEEAVVNLGMMRLSQRKYELALPHLERAAALMPDSPRARYLLGKCLLGLERPGDAIAQLERAASLDPREPAIPLRLSEALLLSAGREREAEAALRRVLALRPDHGTALNRLGRLLERGGRSAEAAPLLARFAVLGRKARATELCSYENPLEPGPGAPAGGPGWLSVRAVGLDKGAASVVTVQAGRLILRKPAGSKAVRFALGGKAEADVIRVDWTDGTHTHRIGVPANREVVVEAVSAHIW